MQYYNRYQKFIVNGEQTTVPFVAIPQKTTDKRVLFKQGKTRMDKLSQQFYGTPYFGFLILSANPEFGGLEFNIPDSRYIRIPFPLISSLQDWKGSIDNYFFLFGR